MPHSFPLKHEYRLLALANCSGNTYPYDQHTIWKWHCLLMQSIWSKVLELASQTHLQCLMSQHWEMAFLQEISHEQEININCKLKHYKLQINRWKLLHGRNNNWLMIKSAWEFLQNILILKLKIQRKVQRKKIQLEQIFNNILIIFGVLHSLFKA